MEQFNFIEVDGCILNLNQIFIFKRVPNKGISFILPTGIRFTMRFNSNYKRDRVYQNLLMTTGVGVGKNITLKEILKDLRFEDDPFDKVPVPPVGW